MRQAEEGIAELKECVDSLMVIPNDRLRGLSSRGTSIIDAFKPANEVLHHAIRGITEVIYTSGHLNVDFADLRTIMGNRGMAIMGIGTAEGTDRARLAAERAITSPLLEGFDISSAKGVLLNIAGPPEMTMDEYQAAIEVVQERLEVEDELIVGLVLREDLEKKIQVTAIATGV